MLRHSLMHHNKTSQYTFVQTHCHPHANIDNHFAIHKYQAKQLLIFAVLPRQAPRPDREQRLSEALTTPQTRHQSAPSGPGAADLRDADSSTHSILSISSPQFSTARRAAAPGPRARRGTCIATVFNGSESRCSRSGRALSHHRKPRTKPRAKPHAERRQAAELSDSAKPSAPPRPSA